MGTFFINATVESNYFFDNNLIMILLIDNNFVRLQFCKNCK